MARYNFTGEFSCSLDAKNRFNLPAQVRKMLGTEANGTLVFAPGFEEINLYVYPLDEWYRLTDSFKNFKPNNQKAQIFIRRFVGGAHTVAMDAQGRLMLPRRILDKAGIASELLFLGTINKLEVWNPKKYDAYLGSSDQSLSDLVAELDFTSMINDGNG